jgi:glycosyltransferase involved in cell wall biosynthesis
MNGSSRDRRIDVVVAHYNHGEYLETALDSLLAQSVSGFDIIVVDDGSTELASKEVLARLGAHPCVRVVYRDHQGVGAARNAGIQLSDAQYIFVMDADDRVEPSFIEECLAVLDRRPEVGIVSSWIRTFGVGEWLVKPAGGLIEDFLHKNNCPGQAVIRRTCWEQTGGYREELGSAAEDWEFYLSVLERRWRAHIVEKPLLHYRVQRQSANTASQARRSDLYRRIVALHEDTYRRCLIEVLCRKEQQLVDQHEVIREMMLTHADLELPEITFGDGGMALRTAVECERSDARPTKSSAPI